MRSAFRFGLACVVVMLAFQPARAAAETYTFSYCFDNNSGLCTTLADQMKIEVTDAGDGKVNFEFTNEVGLKSNMAELYFDADGFLSNMSILSQDGGAKFVAGTAQPPDPPGGTNAMPPFVTTASLISQAKNPAAQNGLNSTDDELVLQFDIASGLTFADIIDALNLGPNEGDGIRIAAHVTGIGSAGQSDTFICCDGFDDVTPSPEPATMSLFGMAALAAAYGARRRRS